MKLIGSFSAPGRRPRPRSRISPASGAWTPARILISVDLPAPFSPSSACTSPAAEVEIDAVERERAGEALGEAADGEQAALRAASTEATSATADLRRFTPHIFR